MAERQPPKPPLIYRFVRDMSGQSETFGVLLLLAITIVGTVAIVTFDCALPTPA
jgi:flagellin-like protein